MDEDAVKLAREISARLAPSEKFEELKPEGVFFDGKMTVQHWSNGLWNVTARLFRHGWPFGGGKYVLLCIHCEDGEPRHDWRVFQAIKNQLCGREWEAIELYPAESRLLDPSNLFMLWCAPRVPRSVLTHRSQLNNDLHPLSQITVEDWWVAKNPSLDRYFS